MCEQRENLIAYLYDEADANERRAVEHHLASCDTCRDELRAFRDVRQDLLAWDVPETDSVWKPFATPRPQPVWRALPAWGLAAAAALVFAIGGAGGYAGRAIAMRGEQPAQTASIPPAAPAVVTPAANRDELISLENRLGQLERAANTRPVSVQTVSAASGMSDAALLARVEQLIRESEGRVTHKNSQRILSMIQEFDRQRTRDNTLLQQQIAAAQEATNGTILAVKNNLRGEKEKE